MDIKKIATKFWMFHHDGESVRPIDLEDLQAYTNDVIETCITELHLNGELQAIECIRNLKVGNR
jgi:hypothetical protein